MIKLQAILHEIKKDKIKNILTRLYDYKLEYEEEGNKSFASAIKKIIKYIKNNDFDNAIQVFHKTGLKYDIGNTFTELDDIKNDYYIETKLNKDWCLSHGTYIAWRAGKVENTPNGIFFSIDKQGAESYSDKDRSVNKYEVTIKRPLIAKNVVDALSKLTKKNIKYFITQRDNSYNIPKWWLKKDEEILSTARNNGYDSIVYTKPSPPALKELVLFDTKQAKKI